MAFITRDPAILCIRLSRRWCLPDVPEGEAAVTSGVSSHERPFFRDHEDIFLAENLTLYSVLKVSRPSSLGFRDQLDQLAGQGCLGRADGDADRGALLHALGCRYGPLPAVRLAASGYGAGSRDVPGQANVLPALPGEPVAAAAGGAS